MLPEQNRTLNMDRMRYLLKRFGHPEKSFVPVLIAGTKGKGSTGFFLQAILEEAGITSGFYSSPHLVSPLERIRIRGRAVSPKIWSRGLTGIRNELSRKPVPARLGQVTYFEVITLLALRLFQDAAVQVAVLEVGLGGRLDATNAVEAPVSVITTLGLDHEALLGSTLAKITREKAAIIRPLAKVVIVPQKPEARRVLKQVLTREKAQAYGPLPLKGVRIGLEGAFQKINAGAAARAAGLLIQLLGGNLKPAVVRAGLARSDWACRMDRFEKKGHRFLLDGAHNPASAGALVKSLLQTDAGVPGILIFGASRDKRSDLMLRELARFFDTVILTRITGGRSQELETLMIQARPWFRAIFPAANLAAALRLASKITEPKALTVITGSLYLAGEACRLLGRKP